MNQITTPDLTLENSAVTLVRIRGREKRRRGRGRQERRRKRRRKRRRTLTVTESVRFGCLFTRKPGLGYSRGDKYSQAGGWTTGYPLITPESSRGVPTTFSNLKALAYMRQPDPLPPTV
jgi:hypothetical protein